MSRKHRSQTQWLELINAFEVSGQSQIDFCAEHNVSSAYFSQRRRALRNPEQSVFIEAKAQGAHTFLAPVSPTLMLRYQQTELALPLSVEPRWLAGLIKALSA